VRRLQNIAGRLHTRFGGVHTARVSGGRRSDEENGAEAEGPDPEHGLGKHAAIEASGNRSFPLLDQLYQTSHPNPQHWDDYDGPLVEQR
jgi:hypothetical protein